MKMSLKTKLTLGISFLFLIILAFGILCIFYINRLSSDAQNVLKNNHESLVYCNNMLKALEDIPLKQNAIKIFNDNLRKQEANITEVGEKEVTQELRKNFDELVANPADSSNYPQIRQSIQVINDLNQQAILRKNAIAQQTASDANLWLSVIFCVIVLIAFTLVVNFQPIKIIKKEFI